MAFYNYSLHNPWLSDCRALCGILFALKIGCGWNALPRALGCGSGSIC